MNKNKKILKIWKTPKILQIGIIETKSGTPKNGETGKGHAPAIPS